MGGHRTAFLDKLVDLTSLNLSYPSDSFLPAIGPILIDCLPNLEPAKDKALSTDKNTRLTLG